MDSQELIHTRLRDYMMSICKPNTPLLLLEEAIGLALVHRSLQVRMDCLLDFLAKHSMRSPSARTILQILNSYLNEDTREKHFDTLLDSLQNWESALENLDAARVAHMNSGHTTKDACKAAKTIAERREMQARLEMRRAYRVFRDNQLEQVMAVQP